MRRFQLLLAALLLLAACGGASIEQGAAPTPGPAEPTTPALSPVTPGSEAAAPNTAADSGKGTATISGASLSGQAVWGDTPVAGATIELRASDWRASGSDAALASTQTDERGTYAFERLPPGEYSVVALWPTGEVSVGGTPVVTITGDEAITDTLLRLERAITLLEPQPGEPVGATPTIRWQAVEGVATYRVMVIDIGTSEAVVQEEVTGESLSIEEALEPSRSYTLVVSGVGPDGGEPLASATLEFTVGGETNGLALPEACYLEGQTIFADRDLGVCFALPQGFALSADETGPEIAGRPLIAGPEPLVASLDIERRGTEGMDLAALVDAYLAEQPDTGIQVQRTPVTLGGEAAVVLEPVPGRLSSRQIAVVHGPQDFYIFNFGPSFRDTAEEQWTGEMREAQTQSDELFETATLSFAFLPPPGVPSAGAVAVPEACATGRTFYLNLPGGYCFAVPAGFTTRAAGPGAVEVLGPARDEAEPPLQATLTMATPAPADNLTLQEVVDAYVTTMAGEGIVQSEATLGGEPSIVLDHLPGDDNWRDIFVLRDGMAFHFLFRPEPASFPDVTADARALIDTIQASFTFLESAQ